MKAEDIIQCASILYRCDCEKRWDDGFGLRTGRPFPGSRPWNTLDRSTQTWYLQLAMKTLREMGKI